MYVGLSPETAIEIEMQQRGLNAPLTPAEVRDLWLQAAEDADPAGLADAGGLGADEELPVG